MKRRIMNGVLAAAMALCMCAGSTMPAMAAAANSAEINMGSGSDQHSDTCRVVYEGAAYQTFTVTIPKYIELGSDKQADYGVTVKGDVAVGSTVDVVPNGTVTMNPASGFAGSATDITVTQADTQWSFADITKAVDGVVTGTAKSGHINGSALTLGRWSGELTFNIQFNDEYGE